MPKIPIENTRFNLIPKNPDNKEYSKTLLKIAELEDKLINTLEGNEKELFLEYIYYLEKELKLRKI